MGVRELGLTYIWLAIDSPLWDSARSEEHYTEDPRRGGEATYQATNRRRQPVERIRDTSQRVDSDVTAGPLHRSVLDGYGRYGYNITFCEGTWTPRVCLWQRFLPCCQEMCRRLVNLRDPRSLTEEDHGRSQE